MHLQIVGPIRLLDRSLGTRGRLRHVIPDRPNNDTIRTQDHSVFVHSEHGYTIVAIEQQRLGRKSGINTRNAVILVQDRRCLHCSYSEARVRRAMIAVKVDRIARND
jgi:hypothetical protein